MMKKPQNQCDGCRRKLPIVNGTHKGPSAWDLIGCTAELYKESGVKKQHITGHRTNARETLASCGITVGSDFHTLSSWHIDALLKAADHAKYKKPPNANGSRARYFHDLLQRRAQMKTE